MSKHKISDEEKALFASWMKDVRPLKNKHRKVLHFNSRQNKPGSKFPRPENALQKNWSDAQHEEQMLSTTDYSSQRNTGIQKQLFKKLRQGKIPIEARLDLHGLTVNQARSQLGQFIHSCQSKGIRCVCIVHGKGTHSKHDKAILKSMVAHWLQQAPEVLALNSALPRDGGTGALYVLLKKSHA